MSLDWLQTSPEHCDQKPQVHHLGLGDMPRVHVGSSGHPWGAVPGRPHLWHTQAACWTSNSTVTMPIALCTCTVGLYQQDGGWRHLAGQCPVQALTPL